MRAALAGLAIGGFSIGLAACSGRQQAPPDPLNGAWRLVTMRLIAADGKSFELPARESLIIFANGYYSIDYAFGDSAAAYAERWRPSESEKVARFSSMIVNAGSYRLDGARMIAKPLFALAPEFVGGEGVFSYAFAADTLELTWERSVAFDGLEYPSRGTVTLLRFVRAD
jgi:hypothetical protein